jgi:hypothetical protein
MGPRRGPSPSELGTGEESQQLSTFRCQQGSQDEGRQQTGLYDCHTEWILDHRNLVVQKTRIRMVQSQMHLGVS